VVVLVHGGTVCTVQDPAACDQLSKEVASRFVCDDSTSAACASLLQQQLNEIAPTNFASASAMVSAVRPLRLECEQCNELFS
jgi:hypothetical protein